MKVSVLGLLLLLYLSLSCKSPDGTESVVSPSPTPRSPSPLPSPPSLDATLRAFDAKRQAEIAAADARRAAELVDAERAVQVKRSDTSSPSTPKRPLSPAAALNEQIMQAPDPAARDATAPADNRPRRVAKTHPRLQTPAEAREEAASFGSLLQGPSIDEPSPRPSK